VPWGCAGGVAVGGDVLAPDVAAGGGVGDRDDDMGDLLRTSIAPHAYKVHQPSKTPRPVYLYYFF